MSREGQDFGPTVVDGFVRRTSVSALTSFDPESYAGCPLRWWQQRVGGKPEPETKSQGQGKAIHSEVEEYLKTGNEGVLGPIAREGLRFLPRPGDDLVIEGDFGDLGEALAQREAFHRSGGVEAGLLTKMERAAGLIAGMVPLQGYIDLRHGRGEFVDATGILLKEKPEHGKVVEVVDHKSTSDIDAYAKSPSEMAETIQMLGYANFVLNVVPDADHVRVSHIYYQTRGSKRAKKITALLSANVAREKWRRVDKLAVYMEEVARQTRPEDVEGNKKSCTAYRGCPHISYCPGAHRSFSKQGDQRMSLFGNTTTPTTNGTPAAAPSGSLFGSVQKIATPAPVSPAPVQDRAAIDAAKQKFAAEDAGAAVNLGFCAQCGTKLLPTNSSRLPNGTSTHIGCGVAQNTVAPNQIVPNDAARPTLVQSANPVPAAELAKVTDPEIQARAAAVQAAHDAKKAADAAAEQATSAKKTGGRCPSGGMEHMLSPKEIASRKTKCPGCGVDIKIKDEHFNQAFTGMTIQKHNMPKVEPVAVPAPVPVPVPAPVPVSAPLQAAPDPTPTPVQPTQTVLVREPFSTNIVEKTIPVAQTASQNGIFILVDALKERGPRPTPLEDYWRPMVTELEKQAGGCDLRCAAKDTPVAYGAWKGFLTTWVKESPPAPGVYFARGGNDFDMVVVDALGVLADITRGVR